MIGGQVESLFPLATKAILQGMVIKLKASHQVQAQVKKEKPPAKKKRKVDSVDTSDSPSVVEDIRGNLNEYLVSWYSKVRPEIVDQFIAMYCYNRQQTNPCFDEQLYLDFFDSILDHTFTSWTPTGSLTEIVTRDGNVTKLFPFHVTDPIRLLQIITSRSPLIKNLDFSICICQLAQQAEPVGKSFATLLGILANLTSLTLSFGTNYKCLDFFSSLGQSCPQLTNLTLGEVPFGTDQILALMLVPKRALLPPDFPKHAEKLMDLQFTSESISPICNTLKELHISCYKNPVLPVAFILRHFRQLERFKCSFTHLCGRISESNDIIVAAVLHLHQQQSARRSSRQKLINKKSSEELGFIEWTVQSPFIGNLNLFL